MGTKSNPGKFDCWSRAEPDEPVFVLLGRDPVASLVVEYWAELRAVLSHKNGPEQLNEALDCAREMRTWAEAHGKEEQVRKIREVEKRHQGRYDRRMRELCKRAADFIELLAVDEDLILRNPEALALVKELRGK
jgi:hypothetical protein